MASQPRYGTSSSTATLLMRYQEHVVPMVSTSKQRMSISACSKEMSVMLVLTLGSLPQHHYTPSYQRWGHGMGMGKVWQ